MTQEQIKENANEFATHINGEKSPFSSREYEAYIAGAHSRDEEIKELKHKIKSIEEDRRICITNLLKECDRLRNPWISVEDRLPEENCVVFVSLDGTEYLSAHYRVKSKRFVTVSKDKQTLVEVRKSTATYTVCGDCIKEERLYSEGQREDITSLVTHWMPIPQIEKEIIL